MTRHIAKNQVFPVNSRLCSKHLIKEQLKNSLLQVQFVLEKTPKKASDFFFFLVEIFSGVKFQGFFRCKKKNYEVDIFLKNQLQRRRRLGQL